MNDAQKHAAERCDPNDPAWAVPDQSQNSHAGQHTAWGIFFEVFWAECGEEPGECCGEGAGWYWWACQPGCLPEGDAFGPFNTSLEAYEDAVAAYDDGSVQ